MTLFVIAMAERKRTRLRLWVAEPRQGGPVGPGAREGVGPFLSRTREQRGYRLEDVASALRIPSRHLEAIEAGRFDALPGRIYAIGFLRAYAELLGVDTGAVLARYKAETGATEARPELVFPEPVAERRVPGGALAAVGVCAAIAVYATWYYETAQQVRREAVTPVPVHLAATTEPDSSTGAVAGERQVAVAAAAPEQGPVRIDVARPQPVGQTAPADSGGLTAVASRPRPAGGETAMQVSAMRVSAPPASDPEGSAARSTLRRPDQAAAPTPASEAGGYGRAGRSSGSAPGFLPQPVAAVRSTAPEPPPLPSAAMLGSLQVGMTPTDVSNWAPVMRGGSPAQAAEVSGSGVPWNPDGRQEVGPIILAAVEASWIEVRGSGGEVVHAKLLKPGDSYTIPDRPGLKLTTGNAGGLEIQVGGRTAPRLGPRGAVMREIALDGTRLLAGETSRN